MAITIKLKQELSPAAENWLAKNVGPRLHFTHKSVGGEGWIAKKVTKPELQPGIIYYWALTLEDERYASFFLLKFPQ